MSPRSPPTHWGGAYGLYLGTLLPFKGVGTLLRALAKTVPHPFHVLGDGDSRVEWERLADDLGIRDRVEFRGFLQGADLERERAGARYAVVPSKCYENLPYAAMELMIRGIPVVASNLGGLPELVRDGDRPAIPGGRCGRAGRPDRTLMDQGGAASRVGCPRPCIRA